MASRPKTRARLQGALASRKDKRTSYPPPATHQEAPRNDFWGLFLAFRYKRASSSVNARRTALRPSRSPLALQLLAGLPHLLRLGGQCAKLLADALHLALDDPVGCTRVLLDPQSSLVLLLARRVNSAIRERVGLGLRERRPRRPVVTHCYIDPSTRTERTSFALRPRLRRRSRAAARPSACADTRAPLVVNASRAC